MADLTDFQVTDDVTDNLATYHNRLLGGIFRAEFANTETLSATKELADSDCQYQIITAGSTDRTVELAPEASTNHLTVVYNDTPSSDGYNVLVKDDSGATTYVTLAPAQYAVFLPFDSQWKTIATNSFVPYTPSWTNLTVGDGTLDARYTREGGWISGYIMLTWGSTTSISGAVSVSLPAAMHSSIVFLSLIGDAILVDQGTGSYVAKIIRQTSTVVDLYAMNASATYTSLTAVTSTVPFTFTNGDYILITFRYKAA